MKFKKKGIAGRWERATEHRALLLVSSSVAVALTPLSRIGMMPV